MGCVPGRPPLQQELAEKVCFELDNPAQIHQLCAVLTAPEKLPPNKGVIIYYSLGSIRGQPEEWELCGLLFADNSTCFVRPHWLYVKNISGVSKLKIGFSCEDKSMCQSLIQDDALGKKSGILGE